ncbi:hypothetical protein AB6A40_008273 [Gnathostoma spinigerum]|uniref:Sec24-like protein n=1 Tax=Gnathostoma spinigerum TaxID=75299 RepID=A0ABD6ETR3_9BILA
MYTIVGFSFIYAFTGLFLLVCDYFSEPFLPVPSGLLVNLKKHIEVLRAFIESIPSVFECCSSTASCLGAAVTIAKELISDIGGRITVFQTVLPTLGPGSLHSREDPNQRAAEEVSDLGPATDFYKGLALECTYRQIAIDLFLLSSSYSDLSSIAEMARTSGGCIYYYPGYHINREQIQVRRFQRQLSRYFTRKIGFEAVLRIRCSRGLSLSSFHGNFFVRSTDLMALPNANPDSALGVQLQMDENLGGLSTASFQAALLYTSSKGDRRIRIHTLCLPITRDLPTIFTHFDVIAAVSLLSKMAVQRCMDGATLRDCREAMINAAVDAFGAYNAAISSSGKGTTMLAPTAPLRLFPLYILGMLKHRAFASGRSIKLDTRVADLLQFRSAPLDVIICEILPKIYCLNHFIENEDCPAELALSFQHINKGGIYLMNSGSYLYIYVSSSADPTIIEQLFGVKSFSYIDEDKAFESIDTTLNERVTKFIKGMHVHRSQFAVIVIIREDSALRDEFIRRLIEDRTESTHSYIEFLHHVRQEMMR